MISAQDEIDDLERKIRWVDERLSLAKDAVRTEVPSHPSPDPTDTGKLPRSEAERLIREFLKTTERGATTNQINAATMVAPTTAKRILRVFLETGWVRKAGHLWVWKNLSAVNSNGDRGSAAPSRNLDDY